MGDGCAGQVVGTSVGTAAVVRAVIRAKGVGSATCAIDRAIDRAIARHAEQRTLAQTGTVGRSLCVRPEQGSGARADCRAHGGPIDYAVALAQHSISAVCCTMGLRVTSTLAAAEANVIAVAVAVGRALAQH